jgi:hypothetical protein
LSAQDVGPLQAEITTHAGELTASARINETELALGSERLSREENPSGASIGGVVTCFDPIGSRPGQSLDLS